MRASVSAARRQSTSRAISTAYGTHSSGARTANTSAVAFTLPTIWTTMANDGGISPSALAQRVHHEREQPPQPRPRQQDHRDAGRVVERVRAQHVREGGDDRARSAHVDRAEQEQHAEPGEEHDAAEPDALRDPARARRRSP